MSARRGFTFIEMLVVIAIIAALAGMSLAGLSVLRRQEKIASTLDLMTHVTTAIDQYLQQYARLGADEDSGDFLNDPWEFLYKQQHRIKQQPLIDIKPERLVKKLGPGACVVAPSMVTATHISDHFGNYPGNVLSFTIINKNRGSSAATRYVQCIILRSSAATQGDPKDDLIFVFSNDKASWRKVRQSELEAFLLALDPPPSPVPDIKWVDPLKDF